MPRVGCVPQDNTGTTQKKKYISGYLLTASSFDCTLTDDILKYILTKGSTHLLEKSTIVVIADAEMKNIPFVYVDVL
jgi:hypothetical protein